MTHAHLTAILAAITILAPLSARADAPPGVSTASPGLLDRIAVSYWGNYSGPSISRPDGDTTSPFGQPNGRPQIVDDLLTAGYQVTPGFRPGIGIPFNILPANAAGVQIKPLYFGIVDATLVHQGNLSIHADLRFYTPLGDVAASQDVRAGIRTSQLTLYPVPRSRWLLGSYSFVRAWAYGPGGQGFRNDLELYFSPFAQYRLSRKLSLTVWSDWIQLGHQYGTPFGLSNLPVDVQPGIKWDITPQLNVNPYFNIIPASPMLTSVSVGMVVMAAIL